MALVAAPPGGPFFISPREEEDPRLFSPVSFERPFIRPFLICPTLRTAGVDKGGERIRRTRRTRRGDEKAERSENGKILEEGEELREGVVAGGGGWW